MRKTVAVVAAISAGVLIAWIAGSRALSGETLVTNWPSPSFARQFPNREENASATRLMATLELFGDDLASARPALVDYIRYQRTRPPILDTHANAIRTLRAQIVSNAPPVWRLEIDDILEPPAPPLTAHMQLFQLFGADALAQHASGNDQTAWADLHAAWILARSLWDRPETMSIATALVGSRVIAAVSAKLDPPAPAWWTESAALDVRLPLLHSIEYEAWATRLRAERYPVGEPDGSRIDDTIRQLVSPFIKPIRIAQANMTVGRMRTVAAAVSKSDPCEPFVIAGMPEWSGFVRRFNRFRIEREGVDKFLTRAFTADSQCRNGRWQFDGNQLAFHGALPPATSRMTTIPLAYAVPSPPLRGTLSPATPRPAKRGEGGRRPGEGLTK